MKSGSPLMLRLQITPHEGRAKDGSLSTAGGLAVLGRLVGRGTARTQSLAAVVDSSGDAVCPRTADRHDLAPRSRNSGRLRRLLLLSPAAGTQVQETRRATVRLAVGAAGDGLAAVAGRRRLAHQALRT